MPQLGASVQPSAECGGLNEKRYGDLSLVMTDIGTTTESGVTARAPSRAVVVCNDYSYRNATMGSTLVARRAGI
jgi:hypothetical protein